MICLALDAQIRELTWKSLGRSESESMPIGNGDLAANVWTEQNGDIVILLSKADAWSENGQLLKLGRVRVSLSPNPFVGKADFRQVLHFGNGKIVISSGKDMVSVWADANNPVIRVQVSTVKPVKVTARNEVWRKSTRHLTQAQVNENPFNYWESRALPGGIDLLADHVFAVMDEAMAWCHFNTESLFPIVLEQEHLGALKYKYPDPLMHRCFGVLASGNGLVGEDSLTVASSTPSKRQELDLYALTEHADKPDQWLADIQSVRDRVSAVPIKKAQEQHDEWWRQYWNRSYIRVSGDSAAQKVTDGYMAQRYMNACAGRGFYPMKFNGSLFTVGHDLPDGAISTTENHDPDFRDWGGCYWNQNTRHIYYPLVASGDYDLLHPWFNLYLNSLPLAKDRTRLYFNHGGASYIETILFWGLPNLMDWGWDNKDVYPQSGYMRYHTQGAIEVVYEMLDYYDNVQDVRFLKDKLLPFADAILTYYNEHWKKGTDGKIVFDPSQSIEVYQKGVVNPTPDIAGLWSVTEHLSALPVGLTSPGERQLWADLRSALPPIPVGKAADGSEVILPAKVYGEASNAENPELYPVFPYRSYCLGKEGLALAINTFEKRKYPFNNCWGQDGMEAALLGLTDVAREAVVKTFTTYGTQKFPWFWRKVADYSPDMDNGGTGMETLQLMLMQTEGKTIRLIPAWPKNWSAEFKLHAPYNTIVEAKVEHGEVTRLNVIPVGRMSDVIIQKKENTL